MKKLMPVYISDKNKVNESEIYYITSIKKYPLFLH